MTKINKMIVLNREVPLPYGVNMDSANAESRWLPALWDINPTLAREVEDIAHVSTRITGDTIVIYRDEAYFG